MNHETLQELFVGQLRDIYDAEKQLVKTLPKIAKAAESSELADAIRSHLSETETQVSRLEEIFGMVGVAAKGKPCKGMKGLLEEGDEAIKEEEKGTLRDLTLIAERSEWNTMRWRPTELPSRSQSSWVWMAPWTFSSRRKMKKSRRTRNLRR